MFPRDISKGFIDNFSVLNAYSLRLVMLNHSGRCICTHTSVDITGLVFMNVSLISDFE